MSTPGGSWAAVSRVIRPIIGVITIVVLLIANDEPPSRVSGFRV